MPLTLSKFDEKNLFGNQTVDLGDAGSITVKVARITLDQRLRDYGFDAQGYYDDRSKVVANSAMFRIESTIVGWSDVVDEIGAPIPFTPEALRQAMNACPILLDKLLTIANRAFSTAAADDAVKN